MYETAKVFPTKRKTSADLAPSVRRITRINTETDKNHAEAMTGVGETTLRYGEITHVPHATSPILTVKSKQHAL